MMTKMMTMKTMMMMIWMVMMKTMMMMTKPYPCGHLVGARFAIMQVQDYCGKTH